MNVDVMVNGRPWKVALEPAEQAGQFTVTIKGKSRVVDASWVDADTLSLIDAGTAREIRLHARGDNGAVGVELGGKLYEAVVSDASARLKSRPAGAGLSTVAPEGAKVDALGAIGLPRRSSPDSDERRRVGLGFSQAIKAPMPGRVVRVLVAVGDRVTARQGVVVVEAMKMENELRTPRDGTVTEIAVVPGAAVEAGAVLLVIGD